MTASVQVRSYVGAIVNGQILYPHTFIVVTQPDGKTSEYGLVPAVSGSASGPGKIDVTGSDSPSGQPHDWSVSTPAVQLTTDQYNRLMNKINESINNPPDYTFPGQWWPSDGDNCTGWVNDVWQASGLPDISGVTDQSTWNPYGQATWIELNKLKEKIKDAAKSAADAAKNFVRRRDPLTFDLNGNGLETTAIAATNPILFDHDGDGIKNGTGWVKPDDGFLVDVNGNGTIDNGRELFGDSTILTNGARAGQTAKDGFDALADLDSNADGKIDANDAQFSNLRIWRDLNQDGISQTGELFTLASLNIASINVTSTAHSQTLANGNQIADIGSYTKTDGSQVAVGEVTGSLADVNLASDTFHRSFTDVLDTTAVATLPDMQACPERSRRSSGKVRGLRGAATQSKLSSVQLLTQYLSQIANGDRRVAFSQCASQGIVNQSLITFTNHFTALFKTNNHRIIQINCNARFTLWRNYRTALGIGHIIISFHKISFHVARQALPKLNGHFYHAASNILQQRA